MANQDVISDLTKNVIADINAKLKIAQSPEDCLADAKIEAQSLKTKLRKVTS